MPTKTMILSFDMETDIGSYTHECRGLEEGAPEILRVLAEHGVPATFLFVAREAQSHPGLVQRVLAEGHEVGCHTMYHETMGRAVFDMPGDFFVLDGEIRGRLELATETIEKVASLRPVSFRAPRLFGSTLLLNTLADLGYVADSSFPAYFHGRSFAPYRPSREDWAAPGDLPLLEIPVFYDAEVGVGEEKNRSRDQWPMLRLKGPDWFAGLCRRMFQGGAGRENGGLLCVYLHPWEFVSMPETIYIDEGSITFKPFLHRNTGRFAVEALDRLIGEMTADGVAFATMRQAAQQAL